MKTQKTIVCRGRHHSETASAPLSDELKETLRDILCSSACAFSDHCDGWRCAPSCQLMDSGSYPEYLRD